jgi:hypothetical protein
MPSEPGDQGRGVVTAGVQQARPDAADGLVTVRVGLLRDSTPLRMRAELDENLCATYNVPRE